MYKIKENITEPVKVEPKKFNLAKMMIKASDSFPQNQAVLLQGKTRIMSIGDISVIAGMPKTRKTFLVSGIITAFLGEYFGLTSEVEGSCLLVDTEQSKAHTLAVVQRIYRLMRWDYNNNHKELITLSLREFNSADRLAITEQAIKELSPKLVVIDGFADLLANTNDLEECTRAVSELMRLSTENKCHITSVVHTNPSSEKMRGHVGSELQRKAESVLLVTRSEDITTISPQFTRNLEFKKFSFMVNDGGLPVSVDYVPSPEDSTKILIQTIFSANESLSYGDIKKAIMSSLAIKESAAKQRITKAIQMELIIKEKIGNNYRLRYDDEPEQQTLDNLDDLPY